MTNFIGTAGNDVANAAIGQLKGFTGGNAGQLTDGVGDSFFGGDGEDFVFAANANDFIEGGEGHDTLNGGAGIDTIFGNTQQDPLGSLIGDEIVGNQGNDVIRGSNGGDSIDGGDDNDFVQAGGGNDLVQGGSGIDVLVGDDGNDIIYGLGINLDGDSDNSLFGVSGDDVLIGARQKDLLEGGTGADAMHGGAGDDTFDFNSGDVIAGEIIDGGADIDRLFVESSTSFMSAASISGIEEIELYFDTSATFSGTQVATGLDVNSLIMGRTGSAETFRVEMASETVVDVSGFGFRNWETSDQVTIIGDADDEFITGTVQADSIHGNDGDDTLAGSRGVDRIFGGPGNDVYLVDQPSEASERPGEGNDAVLSFVTYNLGANLENLMLVGGGNINGIGNTLANTIIGSNGDNILNGGAGVDVLQGGLGDDSYAVDSALDKVVEAAGQGTDNVNASLSYVLAAGVSAETLRTTNSAASTAINLTGNEFANIVTGNAGNNVLNGGGAADTMQGLAGNDIYVVDNVGDKAVEAASAGTDTVDSAVTFTLGANVENLTLLLTSNINGVGNTSANVVTGNGGANALLGLGANDRLLGLGGNDILDGGVGIDRLEGGSGNDTYIIDSASEVLVEVSGIDLVRSTVTKVLATGFENLTLLGTLGLAATGNVGANILIGNSGGNVLSGLGGNDTMNGGVGNVILVGGIGKDTMTGSAGADKFDFNLATESVRGLNRDTIVDFVRAQGDKIDLSTIDADTDGTTGNQAFAFIGAAAFTGVDGQLRCSAGIVQGDTNGDRVADFEIKVNLATLIISDFVL